MEGDTTNDNTRSFDSSSASNAFLQSNQEFDNSSYQFQPDFDDGNQQNKSKFLEAIQRPWIEESDKTQKNHNYAQNLNESVDQHNEQYQGSKQIEIIRPKIEPVDLNKKSFSNLLKELPSPPLPTVSEENLRENPDGTMSISDLLFGLSIPKGSLVGSPSPVTPQTPCGNGGNQFHFETSTPRPYKFGNSSCDDQGYYSTTYSTPNVTPSRLNQSAIGQDLSITPNSYYSHNYSLSSGNSTNNSFMSSPASVRSQFSNFGSPPQYYGRAIRGSPPYSDCSSSSPPMEGTYITECNGSRSNSPADSETSGVSSMDGSLTDLMGYLSMNQHNNLNRGNINEATLKRMALKKYISNCHQPPPATPTPTPTLYHNCISSNNIMSMNCNHATFDHSSKSLKGSTIRNQPSYTWSGELPKRSQKPMGFSSKVFVGGLPYDITENAMISSFKQFGQIRVDWPNKENGAPQPNGFLYVIFESEKHVKNLLSYCTFKYNTRSWHYKISSKHMKGKLAEIIPWAINESNYSKSASIKLDSSKTVFVGALHGMMTAEGLARIMDDLFDDVVYVGIDTDTNKYPIASARVTFSSKRSYKRALAAAFVLVKTPKFTKKIEIRPYLEESACSVCIIQQGPYFCPEPMCFRYFCRNCWFWQHSSSPMSSHQFISRNSKKNPQLVSSNFGSGNHMMY